MIDIGLNKMEADISSLDSRFRELPSHIAKKHLNAAMKRSLKPGVPILKRFTPKAKTKLVLGQDRTTGEYTARRQKGGSLRRSVTTKSKIIRKPTGGTVYGVLGYRSGFESRKAIWLEFGTSNGVRAVGMVDNTMAVYGNQAKNLLVDELAKALEKATRELESKKNPGFNG